MPSLNEDVQQFLHNTRETEGRALDVAILFARLMVVELRATIADWEAAEARLRDIKGRCVVDSN